MAQNQAYLFYIFFLVGVLVGLLFDIFRVLRKCFKHSDLTTIFQDVIFFILSSAIITYTVFKFNSGIFRSYVAFGIGTGLIAYLIIFSKTFIKINVKILQTITKTFKLIIKVVLFPIIFFFTLLKRLLFKPFSFIIINIKKFLKNILNNTSKKFIKIHNKTKKSINKEGFYNNV